jgi:hypothetical protein
VATPERPGESGPSSLVYEHRRCGVRTVLPELEHKLLLADPYQLPYTYCAGCKKHFHDRQFTWADSGENLFSYVKRLRSRKSLTYKAFRLILIPAAVVVAGVLIGWYFGRGPEAMAAGGVGGVIMGWFVAGFVCAMFQG